jgi:hypothetical protein
MATQLSARLALHEYDLAARRAPLRRSQRKLVKQIFRQSGKIRHAPQDFTTRRRGIGHVSPGQIAGCQTLSGASD